MCEKLMMAQDYAGPVRWVVVDDGREAQPITFSREGWLVVVLRPCPKWSPGQNTQARNLAAGLEVIGPNERVAVIEDDDYYAPGYLSAAARWLESADLVGECPARYFNVQTRQGKQLGNNKHASLCSTAVKGPALAALRQAVTRRRTYIDLDLWNSFVGSRKLHSEGLVVGMKGLPGRGGIGSGHTSNFGQPMSLADWIGKDAALYE